MLTSEGKCALVTPLHVSDGLPACVDAGVGPGPREGLAFFCPDSSPHSRQGWRERLGTTAAPLQQVAWRKVLTRLQTVGLSMQGQSTFKSFRDTRMDLQALTHTWPE